MSARELPPDLIRLGRASARTSAAMTDSNAVAVGLAIGTA